MERVNVKTSDPYDVLIGRGLLDRAGAETAVRLAGRNVLIVSDENTAPLYLSRAERSFREAGFSTGSFVFPAGEDHKSLATVEKALLAADRQGLTRSDLFAALGGGVIGDMTGLAAALYMRGVEFVQIPTTLLAMVDASVGGKTAVNLSSGKNLCGTFHQPALVICDPDTLRSLPEEVFAEGMAEVIKHGAIGGEKALDRISAGGDIERIIAENVRIKSDVVSRDEFENGIRQVLNFGHTFGHGIEKLSGFSIYHGEGVSIGMMIAAFTAERTGKCPKGIYDELRGLLIRAGLPVTTRFTSGQIAEAALNDKKRRGEYLTVVLPEARGKCALHKIPVSELKDLISCCDGEVTGVGH